MDKSWPIHTLVFDLDDTLFAEEEFVRSGFRAVDEWLRARHGVKGFALEGERRFAAGQRGKIFDDGLAALGHPVDLRLIEEMVAVYRSHRPQLTLLDDAREILPWAKKQFQLALISDGFHVSQARKVEALQLEREVPVRILTDALGREFWKPHPEGFRRVMARLPGGSAGYVYVADNPRKDFIAPRQLGWRTVRIRRATGEHREYSPTAAEAAEVEIGSLVELKCLIRKVEA